MPGRFLTAEWRDLLIISYAVDDALLAPHLPAGLVPDRFEGRAVCSLVGFGFLNTRVLGVAWPGLVNFPEINLRFYVREERTGRRGVVFIRELVTSRRISWVARTVYNEPYARAEITSDVADTADGVRVGYEFAIDGGHGRMAAHASAHASVPDERAPEHWFKEHQWGYGRTRTGRTLRYEVRHPVWATRTIRGLDVRVDWARVYGAKWAALGDADPVSAVLAVGSEVEVYGAQPVA
jgi:hypothetical protein